MQYYHPDCYAIRVGVSLEQAYAHSLTVTQYRWEDEDELLRCVGCGQHIAYLAAYTDESLWQEAPHADIQRGV